jgi:hypothetical protein
MLALRGQDDSICDSLILAQALSFGLNSETQRPPGVFALCDLAPVCDRTARSATQGTQALTERNADEP